MLIVGADISSRKALNRVDAIPQTSNGVTAHFSARVSVRARQILSPSRNIVGSGVCDRAGLDGTDYVD